MQHTMQMNLGGLISILAENLYADPDVFIREMIQNSHDAIAKRQLSADDAWILSHACIEIKTDIDNATITFSDNGAGLSEREIHDYLSTIGSSDKRDLNRQLASGDHADARKLIGQFGIGLLSSFIVANRVKVTTRAAEHPALLWESHGDIHYTLHPGQRDSIGTSVIIHLQPSQHRYLDEDFLARRICTYADLIGIPIFLNNSRQPVNHVNAPWDDLKTTQNVEDYAHFWQQRFDATPPLATLPLDEYFSYHDPQTDQEVTGRIKGVLSIPNQQLPLANKAEVDLFISRMFIASDLPHLLPDWAGFVSGVLESCDLSPNAARDNVMPGSALEAFRNCLGQKIISWLVDLSDDVTGPFSTVVERHWQHLLQLYKQMAEHMDIDALVEHIPLPTNCGPKTLDEYLAEASYDSEGRKQLYYLNQRTEETQMNALAAARGVTVINASHPLIWSLLNRYQQRQSDHICLMLLQEREEDLFQPVDKIEEQSFQPLLQRLSSQLDDGVKVCLCRFQPQDVPAVLSELTHQKMRSLAMAFSPEQAVPSYLTEALSQIEAAPVPEINFYLNVDNLLVHRLLQLCKEQDCLADLLLKALINNATMLHMDELSPQAIKEMFAFNNQLLALMLDQLQSQHSPDDKDSASLVHAKTKPSFH